jgi:hypothetical protein
VFSLEKFHNNLKVNATINDKISLQHLRFVSAERFDDCGKLRTREALDGTAQHVGCSHFDSDNHNNCWLYHDTLSNFSSFVQVEGMRCELRGEFIAEFQGHLVELRVFARRKSEGKQTKLDC